MRLISRISTVVCVCFVSPTAAPDALSPAEADAAAATAAYGSIGAKLGFTAFAVHVCCGSTVAAWSRRHWVHVCRRPSIFLTPTEPDHPVSSPTLVPPFRPTFSSFWQTNCWRRGRVIYLISPKHAGRSLARFHGNTFSPGWKTRSATPEDTEHARFHRCVVVRAHQAYIPGFLTCIGHLRHYCLLLETSPTSVLQTSTYLLLLPQCCLLIPFVSVRGSIPRTCFSEAGPEMGVVIRLHPTTLRKSRKGSVGTRAMLRPSFCSACWCLQILSVCIYVCMCVYELAFPGLSV